MFNGCMAMLHEYRSIPEISRETKVVGEGYDFYDQAFPWIAWRV